MTGKGRASNNARASQIIENAPNELGKLYEINLAVLRNNPRLQNETIQDSHIWERIAEQLRELRPGKNWSGYYLMRIYAGSMRASRFIAPAIYELLNRTKPSKPRSRALACGLSPEDRIRALALPIDRRHRAIMKEVEAYEKESSVLPKPSSNS